MLRDPARPTRTVAGLCFAWLLALALFYAKVLVANPSDNAYLYVALIGFGLGVAGLPFGAAALLPAGRPRHAAAAAGAGLLWLTGCLGVLLLVMGLIVIPFQRYPSSQVFVSHLVALLTLLPTLVFPGFRFLR